MTQVILPEHDDLSMNSLPCQGAPSFSAIGIQEHAALVEAIRQNFPEIYQRPIVFEDCGHSDELRPWSRSLHDPASA